MDVKNSRWFIEFFNFYEAHMRGIRSYLVSAKTKYQTMDIVDSYAFKKCLILDGKIQSSQVDEYIYHECLVHPAMASHVNPKNVLIIGGGEGATLREVLKYKNLKQVVMIDIDGEVVSLCKKYLPEWHRGAFKNKKAKVIIGDGRKFIYETKEKFDVIIIDISEPVDAGPAYMLFTIEFYEKVKKKLNPNGIISLQAGSTSCREWECLASVYKTLQKVFPIVRPIHAFIPSFDTPWGFILASSDIDPADISVNEVNAIIKKKISGDLNFYDGITHQGLFSIPKDLRGALKKIGKVIKDNKPIFTEI